MVVIEVKARGSRFYRTIDNREPALEWIFALKDRLGASKILHRILRAEIGNLGDHKSVGEGVFEFRIQHGPGYRLYFGLDDRDNFIILLVAGDKSSQVKDVKKAKRYWIDYKSRGGNNG